jgi:DNA-binding NtrC family response regulator
MVNGYLSEVTMPNNGTVLIVDSDDKTRDIVFESAVKQGKIPMSCSSCGEARSLLEDHCFKVDFCSDCLPDGEYAEVIRAAGPTPVIVLSRFAEWGPYLAALQAGAFNYIACPPYQAEVDRILYDTAIAQRKQ